MQRSGDILVVDDDVAIVDFVVDLLEDEGYKVRTANNGEIALEAISQQLPGMILVDMRMPQMSGEEFLAHLYQRGILGVPVVLMTADSRVTHDVVHDYAVDYLPKPFDLDQLLECVARYLGQPEANDPSKGSAAAA